MGIVKGLIPTSRFGREAGRFALAFAVCGAVFMSMGMQRAAGDDEKQVIGVTGSGSYLFRIYDDGSVEFLALTQEVLNGKTADWTPMGIDTGRLSRNKPPLPF